MAEPLSRHLLVSGIHREFVQRPISPKEPTQAPQSDVARDVTGPQCPSHHLCVLQLPPPRSDQEVIRSQAPPSTWPGGDQTKVS